MKKYIAVILSIIFISFSVVYVSNAKDTTCNNDLTEVAINEQEDEPSKESGLILDYSLSVSRKGNTTLVIVGNTFCDNTVVKCGFKGLKIERRLNSSSSWSEYYKYGNVYVDENAAHLYDELTVDPGYQYRATCKHYAKKNILNTQTISNASNIVTF